MTNRISIAAAEMVSVALLSPIECKQERLNWALIQAAATARSGESTESIPAGGREDSAPDHSQGKVID